MEPVVKKIKNGLSVLVVPVSRLDSVTVTLWVKAGSRDEDDRISGLAHFLEHMSFKGTKKRPSAKEIAETIDRIGGEFNAATDKEWTNFYIRTRSENIEIAFEVLSDMIFNPLLLPEEIEKEKGVILEEMALYEDTPIWKINDLLENLMFKGSSLGRDVIGKRETVKRIKRNDFLRFRKMYYLSENMLLTVSGGIGEKKVFELAERYFGSLAKGNKKNSYSSFLGIQDRPRLILSEKSKDQAHIALGFWASPLRNEARYTEDVLSAILGGGMSSRLFLEVREKRGLSYSVRSLPNRYCDAGYIQIYAGIDIERVEEGLKVILDELEKLISKRKKIKKDELLKAKEYIKGHIALSLENTRFINEFFGENFLLLKKKMTLKDYFYKIDKVEVDEVYEAAKRIFSRKNLNLAIIGPFKDEEKFIKLIS